MLQDKIPDRHFVADGLMLKANASDLLWPKKRFWPKYIELEVEEGNKKIQRGTYKFERIGDSNKYVMGTRTIIVEDI
jgi:hypothetical protein